MIPPKILMNSLLGSISRMVPSAPLDASFSSYTYFFSVYVYTFTYCIGENSKKKKKRNRNFNVNQLNQDEKR